MSENKRVTIPFLEKVLKPIVDLIRTKADKTDILQSDWNQTDETAVDYVKNRTHYEFYGIAPIIQVNGGGELYSGGAMVRYTNVAPVNDFELFETDKPYIVTYNGVSDTIFCTNDTLLTAAEGGLPNIFANTGISSIMIVAYESDNTYLIRVTGGSVNDVLSVEREGNGVVRLPEKYIPKSIARTSHITDALDIMTAQIDDVKENIKQADWNQVDAAAIDYVKNRTHYDDVYNYEFTWDGNTEGHVCAIYEKDNVTPGGMTVQYCKVSDRLPTRENIIKNKATLRYSINDKSTMNPGTGLRDNYFREYSWGWTYAIREEAVKVLVVNTANTRVNFYGKHYFTFPEPGVYFGVDVNGKYWDYLGWSGREIVQLDEKYIPDTIARVADIPTVDGLASTTYVDTKVADLVNSAPETLDTLNELSAALGDDPNFATTILTEIGNKANKTDIKQADWNETNETDPAFIQNKPVSETEDDAMDMLAEMGILDPIQDEENNILTDEDGNIFTIE